MMLVCVCLCVCVCVFVYVCLIKKNFGHACYVYSFFLKRSERSKKNCLNNNIFL